jgi:DNA mismatch repair protein MutS2
MTRGAAELMESSLEQLEFDRILEHIAGYSGSSLGVEAISELSPGDDPDEINRQVRMVGEMRDFLVKDEDVPMHGVYDVREALSVARISGAVLSPENLLHIQTTIASVRKVHEFFHRRREKSPLLALLTEDVHTNRLLEKHISDAIDDSGVVRDNASRDLARIRRDIIDKSAALRVRLQKILRRVSDEELLTDDYVTLREGRLVLPVRTESKRKIPGIIHGESQSGGTVFLEPAEIFDMNNEISELTFAERREVERILRTLTEEVGSEATMLLQGIAVLKEVDSCYARARYAISANCMEPEITDRDEIILDDARHPLLQLRLDSVVPMSLELDTSRHAVVISGPNAGGKTVAMKTLGLITAMALCGIHPPAGRCIVHPCNVYCDIGDQQSLENDLSTFSSHMSRIGEIVRHVRDGDVVLLDEVGTGTDPDEGGAIAASILDFLLERGAYILATTHHSYLKVYAFETIGVENAGMEFDTKSITPTYRFIVGMPGNSYAFELLERMGFAGEILTAARERLGDERNRMTEIIAQLEESLAEGRSLREEHRRKRDEAESLREKYEAQAQELNQQKRDIISQAREEARQSVAGVNSLIENALREIRSGASNDQVKELRKSIEEVRGRIDADMKAEREEGRPQFVKGDTVRVKGGTQVGELEFDPDEKGNVVVQFGGLRMRSKVDELEVVTRAEVRKQAVSRITVANAEEVSTRVDLRGMYADEAEIRLEQAITAAMNANISQIDVIHGKGTGALRRRVHDYLKGHPAIAGFRLGGITEGGAGITIVEIA